MLGGGAFLLVSRRFCRGQTDLSLTQKHTRVNIAKVCSGGKKLSYGGMGIAPRKDRRSLVVLRPLLPGCR